MRLRTLTTLGEIYAPGPRIITTHPHLRDMEMANMAGLFDRGVDLRSTPIDPHPILPLHLYLGDCV